MHSANVAILKFSWLLIFDEQGSGIPSGVSTPPMSTPVTGHKRMVIPNQPPLTATKKSASKPASQPFPIPVTPVGTLKPQPVPASYATASTPTRPTFNVQVKSAQPAPHFQPPGPQYSSLAPNQVPQAAAASLGPGAYAASHVRAPDCGYAPQPTHHLEPSYTYAPPQARFQDPAYLGGPAYGGRDGAEPSYVPVSSWKPEPAYPSPLGGNQNSVGQHPSPGAKKTYITEPAPVLQPPSLHPKVRSQVKALRQSLEMGRMVEFLHFRPRNLRGVSLFTRSMS